MRINKITHGREPMWWLKTVVVKTTELFRGRACISPLTRTVSALVYLSCRHAELLEAACSHGHSPPRSWFCQFYGARRSFGTKCHVNMNDMKCQHEYCRMIIYLFGLDFVSLSFYDSELSSSKKSHDVTSSYL